MLALDRGHWTVENAGHRILDVNWDEDRCRSRSGFGPENTTRLRRFAIGLIKATTPCIACALQRLNRNFRLVLDYLGTPRNSLRAPSPIRSSGLGSL